MRLTLRTLLAYLDHTLGPKDEAALGEKVQQSSFATDLIRRIEGLLSNARITAPSPDAAGPSEDANAIAEYLDNTLAPEATAEVERQCIDSDIHLAEVAANHQVLTIALGEPAHVPKTLRQRIYAQGANREASSAPSHADETTPAPPATPIVPVGPSDTGVAEATTRLPQDVDITGTSGARGTTEKHSATDSATPKASETMAGARAREALEAMGVDLSGSRPSRVTPWLVSLALAAAFLFVLTQAFQPYLRRPRADSTQPQPTAEIDSPASPESPVPPPRDERAGEDSGRADEGAAAEAADRAEPTASVPDPSVSGAGDTDRQRASDRPQQSPTADRSGAGEANAADPPPPTQRDDAPSRDGPPADGAPADGAPADGAPADGAPDGVTEQPLAHEDVTELDPAGMLDAAAMASEANGRAVEAGEPDESDRAEQTSAMGRVENDGGLLLTQDPRSGVWGRIFSDSEIESGIVLVCGPTFRSRLMLDSGVELTLVGPAGLRIDTHATGTPRLSIDFGRVLLMSTGAEPTEVHIATPAASGVVRLSEGGTTAAVSVDYRRPPGTDPGDPRNSKAVLSLLSVQNRLEWQSPRETGAVSLNTGERMQTIAGGEPAVAVLPTIPAWLDPPAEAVSSLEATARAGLVELLATDAPVELALREAVNFRREEVGALAARTLLTLGMPDSYFGPDGVLNRRGQRTYWPELVASLRQFVDRGPRAAAVVAQAAHQLEGEAADNVLRLLQGFSDSQLRRGGDAMLVAMLDSPVMAVRVLAAETLRQITGTTLYFRPDYETASRRAAGVKKWEARLKRGQIRWNGADTAAETDASGENAREDQDESNADRPQPGRAAAEDTEDPQE